jgi:hypothetical protein
MSENLDIKRNAGVAWLSSARVVKYRVKSSNERSPYHSDKMRLPRRTGRKEGMMSNLHDPNGLGGMRATMARTMRSNGETNPEQDWNIKPCRSAD